MSVNEVHDEIRRLSELIERLAGPLRDAWWDSEPFRCHARSKSTGRRCLNMAFGAASTDPWPFYPDPAFVGPRNLCDTHWTVYEDGGDLALADGFVWKVT